MGTATILGAVYDTVLMPDGKEWTVQNVTYAPLQTSADLRGSLFTQPNANSLHALLASTGWRVPTNDEWYAMGAALSGASWLAGSGTASSGNNVPFDGRFTGGVGAELKDPSGWPAPYNVPPYTGANSYGFSARMQDSAVQKIAIWRCYVPSPGIYSPVWFVADSSDSFLYENGWASSSAAHIRLVRDPIVPFTGFKLRPEAFSPPPVGTVGSSAILGTTYQTVVMPDGKEWMVSPFVYAGSGIAQATAPETALLGRLYTYAEAMALVLPYGWRLPTKLEYRALMEACGYPTDTSVGVERNLGAGALKSTAAGAWDAPNSGAANAFGFNSVGGGYWLGGYAQQRLSNAYLTSTTDGSNVWTWGTTNVSFNSAFGLQPQTTRYSIRLVRDTVPNRTPSLGWRNATEARVVSGGVWRRPTRIFRASGGAWREVTK